MLKIMRFGPYIPVRAFCGAQKSQGKFLALGARLRQRRRVHQLIVPVRFKLTNDVEGPKGVLEMDGKAVVDFVSGTLRV